MEMKNSVNLFKNCDWNKVQQLQMQNVYF